jgi:hypothetical protein
VDLTDRYNDSLDEISDLREQLLAYKDSVSAYHAQSNHTSINNKQPASLRPASQTQSQPSGQSQAPNGKHLQNTSSIVHSSIGANNVVRSPLPGSSSVGPPFKDQPKQASSPTTSSSRQEKLERQLQHSQRSDSGQATEAPTQPNKQGQLPPAPVPVVVPQTSTNNDSGKGNNVGDYDEDFDDYEEEFYDDEE